MFPVSGLSFLASGIFNLSKYSLRRGWLIRFWVMNLMCSGQHTPGALVVLFPMRTSNRTDHERGTYVPQLIILAVGGIVLYVFGIRVFSREGSAPVELRHQRHKRPGEFEFHSASVGGVPASSGRLRFREPLLHNPPPSKIL